MLSEGREAGEKLYEEQESAMSSGLHCFALSLMSSVSFLCFNFFFYFCTWKIIIFMLFQGVLRLSN